MAFNDMARGDGGGNPFGTSDWNDSSDRGRNGGGMGDNLRTPLIDQRGGSQAKGGARGGRHSDGSYNRAIAELGRSIGTFQQHINAAAALSKRVGTPRDSSRVRDQIHSHINDGRALTSSIADRLKEFQRFVSEASGSERNKRRSKHKKLVKDFQRQVVGFEKVATDFIQREEEHRRRSSSLGSDSVHGADRMPLGGPGGGRNQWDGQAQGGGQSQNIMTEEEKMIEQQLVQQELDVNEALIQERKDDMEQVHSKIVQVNDIFKDLANMVEDQGEQIETIRGDLQVAEKKTESGVKELDKASGYQKSTTKKLMFCVMVLMIGIAVVVLITLISK